MYMQLCENAEYQPVCTMCVRTHTRAAQHRTHQRSSRRCDTPCGRHWQHRMARKADRGYTGVGWWRIGPMRRGLEDESDVGFVLRNNLPRLSVRSYRQAEEARAKFASRAQHVIDIADGSVHLQVLELCLAELFEACQPRTQSARVRVSPSQLQVKECACVLHACSTARGAAAGHH
jgi:hypothetical protein